MAQDGHSSHGKAPKDWPRRSRTLTVVGVILARILERATGDAHLGYHRKVKSESAAVERSGKLHVDVPRKGSSAWVGSNCLAVAGIEPSID